MTQLTKEEVIENMYLVRKKNLGGFNFKKGLNLVID